jgi:uncharacterized protein (TIGR03545 family)
MKKWFRWQGLIVFGIFFTLLFLFWILWADLLVKRFIEKTGTRIVGARVELADVDVRLFPLGIRLDTLQVTNPDSPMSNAVEARQIDFSLDGLNLLKRKIIIDTMAMEGVRLNTPRKTSGAVVTQTREKNPPAGSSEPPPAASGLPSFQLPDLNDILAREKLESLEQIKHLQAEIDTLKTGWQNRLADAPDQKTFEQYQARAKKLQKNAKGISGVLTIANDLKKLQKDVSTDIKRLDDLQKDFNRDTGTLKKKLDQLKAAPQQDIDRIMSTYNLSADGLGNVSQLLFGDKIGGTIKKAIFWYGKLKPFLEKAGPGDTKGAVVKPDRGQGVNVRFKEIDPLPDLLARQVRVSLIIAAGDMTGEIRQLTSDQKKLGIPLEFNFSGDKLKGVQSITITGTLDHILPDKATDRVTATVERYRVKDLTLSDSADLPVVLKNGSANLNLVASLHENVLDADLALTMDTVSLAVVKKADGNQLQRALQAALADVSTFSINAKVAGPLDNYRVKMTSDLDRVLKNAVGKQVKGLTHEFQGKLRAGILDKVKGPMADTTASMSGLEDINREIASRLKIGNDVSNSLLKGLGG